MRHFRTADILTTAAAGLALALASRPRSPRPIGPVAQPAPAPPTGCVASEPAPGPRVMLRRVDGSHVGPALVLLREKYRNPETVDAGSGPLPDLDPLPTTLTQQPAETVTAHTDYADLLRSITETVMALVFNLAEDTLDDEGLAPDGSLLGYFAAGVLTEFALGFEESARQHAGACAECAALGETAPRFVRARFCRDIADDLLTNFDSENMLVASLPVAAALDVAASLIDSIEVNTGVEPHEVLDDLTHGLAMATAHVNGFGPFAEPEQG